MRDVRRLMTGHLEGLWRFQRQGCDTTLRFQQWTLLLSFALFLAWLIAQSTSFAYTGLVFTGSLMLISYVWARIIAVQVSCRRSLRFTAVQVGDQLEEVLSLDNSSILPVLFAELIDHSAAPGHSISSVRIGRPRATEQWSVQTICMQRGVFPLGQWEIRFGDPFGIFEVQQVYRQPLEITVYPSLATLPAEIAQQSRTIGDRLSLRQPIPAETVNAMTTRPYVHGDAERRIHWRTSARYGELFVKTFEPESSSVMWLIPDLDATVHLGEGNESSLEKMIVVTASLALQLLDKQLAVGLVLDAAHTQVIPPKVGRGHLWMILRALAEVQTGPSTLAATLAHARSIVSIRDSAVILTPSLESVWTNRLHALQSGLRGGLEVVLLDRVSFGGGGNTRAFARTLKEQGLSVHVIQQQEIRPLFGSYGQVGRWEFKTLSTGRVVVRQKPRSPAPGAA